jgi:endoglycosylceramidase
VFFETTVNGPFVAPGFSDDPNLVFAPHNYAESIGPNVPGLLEVLTDALGLLGAAYGTTTWIGEYGSFTSDPVARTEYMARFNRLQDRSPGAGGTWWQWEQQCGDPHDVAGAYPPSDEWVAQKLPDCADSARMNTPCTARSYPRAMPGRLTSLVAEPCGGPMTVTGSTTAPSTAELWFQGERPTPPQVTGDGLGTATVEPRPGGYRVLVQVSGDYRIAVG